MPQMGVLGLDGPAKHGILNTGIPSIVRFTHPPAVFSAASFGNL